MATKASQTFIPPALFWALPGLLPVTPAPFGTFPLTEEGCIAQGFRKHFQCERCKQWKQAKDSGGTGYGYDSQTGAVRCYRCCAAVERESMRATGRAVLYITRKPGAAPEQLVERDHGRRYRLGSLTAADWQVADWAGELSFPVYAIKRGEHNWRNVYRVDVWYIFEGYVWHGVNLGDNQLLRCKRTRTEWRERSPGSWGEFKPRKPRATKALG